MSDPIDRDSRGDRGRRMRRRGGRRKERDFEPHQPHLPPPAKPPIILAKPTNEQGVSMAPAPSASGIATARTQEKPILMLKSRDDNRSSAPVANALSSSPSGPGETTATQSSYQLQRNPVPAPHAPVVFAESPGPSRLAAPQEIHHCIKLVDESMQWCENGNELLLDQTDFFVVGVLGLQGAGKSTILSLLAGNSPTDSYRTFVFPPQSKDVKEMNEHQTVGIDMFVTPDRVILLDSQALLSSSVLDHLIHLEKKYPAEYNTAENCVEMQSLQLAAFLMTVCNVVLVVQDWFTDMHLLRFLQTAEMLKPSTPSSSHDGSTGQEDFPDYSPYMVFVQNKATREQFSVEQYNVMQQTYLTVFGSSMLKFRGAVNMANGKMLAGLNQKTVETDVNMFILPSMDNHKGDTQETILTYLPEYRGYPSFSTLIGGLRSQIFSMPRESLTHSTHTPLSEKNWFHYAARTWDAVKKSQLMSEYNRLLP